MVLAFIVGVVVGFVVGVLFGRRNTQKVEKAVSEVKADVSKVTGGKLNV
jgi:hypothetical protein